MRKSYHILYLLIASSLLACSPREVRTAQAVVRTADSLWQEGKMYDDSLSLAQAYETLSSFNNPLLSTLNAHFSTDYAHACYHYGRLLRQKDDPVTAMQVFINATHSRTRDYHILGRIYSNMGDMCHRAEEFVLSHDMFEQSANMYWQNGDSLLYFYCLNDMAFELAEQKRKDDALTIIRQIEENCTDYNVLTKTLETRAEACLNVQQYDSVVYYSHLLCSRGNSEPTTFLLRAKAYSMMGCKDSSVYYAQYVLSISNELFDHNSALYILTHNDDSKDREDVRQISADRSDVQKLIEIHQGKLSQAVQLLEQDLNPKPDIRRRILLFALMLLVAVVCFVIYIARKRKKQMTSLAEQHADNVVESIKQHIDTTDINNTLHWKNYAKLKSDADLYMGGIVSKLESCNLNEVEIRFCILTMLDFRLKQIAETIHYGYPSGIKTLKKRVSDQLGTTPPQLKIFLLRKL